jgi:hypothetical protein
MMSGRDTGFVICIENEGFEVSLEKRKVYRQLPDKPTTDESLIRVIDESGEDYLYPSDLFVPIIVPTAASQAFDEASA